MLLIIFIHMKSGKVCYKTVNSGLALQPLKGINPRRHIRSSNRESKPSQIPFSVPEITQPYKSTINQSEIS